MSLTSKAETQSGPVVFVHIPKAAGTTLNRFIERQYSPFRVFTIAGRRPRRSLQRFERFSAARRGRYQVVKGHGVWFLRPLLGETVRGITLLRDPVERVVSSYRYARSSPKHRLHEAALGGDIEEFVLRHARAELHNGQVRALCRKVHRYGEEVVVEDLEEAKRSIEREFVVAGTSERFHESVALMCLALDWRAGGIATRNVTPGGGGKEPIDDETRKLVEELTRMDLELYRWVSDRLDGRLRTAGPELVKTLDQLRQPARGMEGLTSFVRAALSRIASI